MQPLYAAIDLGATKIAAALGTADGLLVHTETIPTVDPLVNDAGPEAILVRIARVVETLATRAGRRPVALGLGVPGLVDVQQGIVRFVPNLPTQWRGVPAGPLLEQALRMPVRLLNDARCATLGELLHGHGAQYPTFALFTLGTGIGGGIVVDRRLRLGPFGAAGELGHQTVLPAGPVCACGNAGCLEALASGPAIARMAGYRDAETAASAARDGEDSAQRAFRTAANYLGIAVSNIVNVLHPDAVLFAGGMSDLTDLLLMPVRAAVNDRVRMFPAQEVAIRRAAAGPQAGLLGAIALNSRPDLF